MNIKEFFNKYNTRYADYDSTYGPQCKDLFNFYNKEVVGGQRIYGDAKDLWNNATALKFYTQIPNTLTFVPKEGDVMIWPAWKGNPYGHVAIVSSANMFWFTSFDQNFPLGTPCHFQRHSYVNPKVLGVLRPKK